MEYILSTVCSGIGSPEFAAEELASETQFKPKIGFYYEINKFARASYEAMYKGGFFVDDMTKAEWEGSEFYSDVFIGGIPCQSFSLAGLRKGELDPRGLLFYDFYRYVKKQQPKAFVIENVKGLLSDSNGKTFQNWLLMLGDSVNGHMQMFNHELSLGYNLHWTVLNTKDFGIPQNRERVFIVGIRADLPNTFRFPIGEPLKLRLKDILEPVVDEKYYLSDTALKYLVKDSTNGWSNRLSMLNHESAPVVGCNTANHAKGVPYNMIEVKTPELITEGHIYQNNSQAGRVYSPTGISPTVGLKSDAQGYIKERVAGWHENENIIAAHRGDKKRSTASELFFHKQDGIMSNIDTSHIPKIIEPQLKFVGAIGEPKRVKDPKGLSREFPEGNRIYDADGISSTVKANAGGPGGKSGLYKVNEATKKGYAIANDGDSINLSNQNSETIRRRVGDQIANTLDTACNQATISNHRIRRLPPLECWRLQGFSDEAFYKAKHESVINATISILKRKKELDIPKAIKGMSDSQLYKQAGNSMTTKVVKGILKNILNCIFEVSPL